MKFNLSTSARHAHLIPTDQRSGYQGIPTDHFTRVFVYARNPKLKNHQWREDLAQLAETIVSKGEPANGDAEEILSALERLGSEGRILLETHKTRERNAAAVDAKKRAAIQLWGKLECEVCQLVFADVYGPHGLEFIECHHREPLASAPVGGRRVQLDDLALVCANCHRMLHWRDWPTLEDLRARIQGHAKKSIP
jgi:predicted HNH restriction endonuclease